MAKIQGRRVVPTAWAVTVSLGFLGSLHLVAPVESVATATVPAPAIEIGAEAFIEAGTTSLVEAGMIPDPDALAAVLDASWAGWPTDLHAIVVDAITGAEVYSRGAEDSIVPASTLKILTSMAALDQLGPDHTFTTSAAWDPEAQELELVGGGDSLLGIGASNPKEAKGRAGLQDLADDVVKSMQENELGGSGTIPVKVNVSRYPDASVLDKRETEMVATGQVGYIRPLALYGARVSDEKGAQRVMDPAVHAGDEFAKALSKAAEDAGWDAEFEYQGLAEDAVPESAEVMGEIESATVAEQVKFGMLVSDNQVMETLGREMAVHAGKPPTKKAAALQLEAEMKRQGLADDALTLADASGLSDKNLISSRQLVQLIERADQTPTMESVFEGMPRNGETGTLKHRIGGGHYQGKVQAKTGTLAITSAMTGKTTTADGREVYFSITAQKLDGAIIEGESKLDEMAVKLMDFSNPGL